MQTLAHLAAFNLYLFGIVVVVMQLLAHELGYRLGCWHAPSSRVYEDDVGLFSSGVLALLAFVLALTLTFANERFGSARDGMLTEANAIQSSWLLAQSVDSPNSGKIKQTLSRYAQLRLDFVDAPNQAEVLDRINSETTALQAEIWHMLMQLKRQPPDGLTNAFILAVDRAFAASNTERFTYQEGVPKRIYWLLLILTLIGMAMLGYRVGIKERSTRLMALVLAIVWSVVIVNIVDLGMLRSGDIRSKANPFEWVLEQMQDEAALL